MRKFILSLIMSGLAVGSFAVENDNLSSHSLDGQHNAVNLPPPRSHSDAWQNMQNSMNQNTGRFEEELKKKLNLTDQQIGQIREIKGREVEEVRNFLAKERKNALDEATRNGGFNEDTFIRASVDNARKLAEIRAKYLKKILSVLNEDQRQKFIEELKNRKMIR